jgi:hypothetical protein
MIVWRKRKADAEGDGCRWRALLCGISHAATFLCFLALLAQPSLAVARPLIWFGADDPWVRNWKHRPANDFMDLFTGDGAWAKDVDVIELSMQFVVFGDENQIKSVIEFAKRRRLKVAMVGLMLAHGPNNCGSNIEGYGGPQGVLRAASRFKRLGGVLTYIVMDEPLYYGSVFPHLNACQTPIPALANEVAERVRQVRSVFPSVKIGEDEVAGLADKFHWIPTLAQWFDAYRKAVGEPLAFIHIDIGWQSPRWPGHLQAIAALARRSGVKFGYYINGDAKDPDDATWTGKARTRAWQIEHNLGVDPDQVVILSWMPHPIKMLPPSDASTLTGVLRCYVAMEEKGIGAGSACRPESK